MNITINHSSNTPIYMQIKNQMKDLILKGIIPDGSSLPSERAMAKVVDVHRNTIIKAYNELKADGLITAVQGKGYQVTLEAELSVGGGIRGEGRGEGKRDRDGHPLPASICWERLVRGEVLEQDYTFDDWFSKSYTARDNISFAGGITPAEAYGKTDISAILTELIQSQEEDIYAYTPYQGLYELRQELSAFLSGKGIRAKHGEIQIVSESNQALDYLSELFLREGDCVLTEEPVSPDVFREFTLAGARVVTVPVDENGMLTDRIEPLIIRHRPKLIYVNSSFQDPSGVVMSLERRRTLLDLSYQYQIPIIEDDGASELDYEGLRVPSLRALDKGDSVIYIYSFALTFAPGVGVAMVAAPRYIIKKLSHLISVRLVSLDSLSQRLLARYMQKGVYQKNLKEICRIYREKRDLMCQRLERAKALGVSFQKPAGGVYVWCRLPENMDSKKLIQKAGKKGVTFIPGDIFFPQGTKGEHYIRLNYSYPGLEQIEKGTELLLEAMKESLV